MQNIITKLQDIIRTHFGYSSELEWKPNYTYQSLLKETYSPIDKVLSVPIYEPKSGHPVAYFKIHNVAHDSEVHREKLRDLVNLSLQSYVNLMDQLDISENLINYLQLELHPQNILRFQQRTKEQSMSAIPQNVPTELSDMEELETSKHALLLKSDSPLKLERLALSLHAASKNHFFLRTDHLTKDFLTSLNDLAGLEKTTLFIPGIESLNARQQKTIETHWLMSKAKAENSLLFIATTQSPLGDLVQNSEISPSFLKNFDFFYVLSEASGDSEIRFESLNQCAHAILQATPEHHLKHHKFSTYTKSCHLIPSCQNLFPTIH
jgi:hypothetical protein